MAAFLPHVFARTDVSKLTADVDPRNTASLALLIRFGFVQTGRASGTWKTHIGTCDSVYLGLAKEDFLASRPALPRA
jgi:RimJ/RimL family protein N-acetyltransferase